MTQAELTTYGFTWGGAEVTRLAEINGTVVIQIAPRHKSIKGPIEIYVSPTGRSIRVFRRNEEVLFP